MTEDQYIEVDFGAGIPKSRAIRFDELSDDPLLRTLYIQKSALKGIPKGLKVSITIYY